MYFPGGRDGYVQIAQGKLQEHEGMRRTGKAKAKANECMISLYIPRDVRFALRMYQSRIPVAMSSMDEADRPFDHVACSATAAADCTDQLTSASIRRRLIVGSAQAKKETACGGRRYNIGGGGLQPPARTRIPPGAQSSRQWMGRSSPQHRQG